MDRNLSINADDLERFNRFVSSHHPVTSSARQAMTGILTRVRIEKGDFFARPEDKEIQLGFILKGLLRTFFLTEKGEEFTTDFCCENDISTNYDVMVPGAANTYYSQAMETVELLKIDYGKYEGLCETHPALQTLKTKLISYHYARKISREKELLSYDAKGRYEQFMKDYAHIAGRVRQYHIATFLGITPVALSRVKKSLKEKTNKINIG